MKNIRIILLFLLISSFSCMDESSGDDNDTLVPNLRTLTSQEQELAAASSNFAIDLYQELRLSDDPNLFFSPFSIQQALSMAMNGNTAPILQEYLSSLRFDDLPVEDANQANHGLTQFLKEVDPKVTLGIANGIWYREGLSVTPSFQQTIQSHYAAALSGLDMQNPASVGIINQWIEDHTENLIQDMLDSLNPDAVMYLVNAIYFKGDWKYRFDKSNTQEGAFHLDENTSIMTDMMRYKEPADIKTTRGNNLTYLELPYSTSQYSMGILLPDHFDLDQTEAQINSENLNHWRNNATEIPAIVVMPKFKMRKKIDNLKEDLESLGLTTPFQPDKRNFTELFENVLEPMKISRVIHDALIEVDEKGTEAAAATVAEITVTSAPPSPSTITLDKPFVFFIQEKHSGAILFMGRLGDPSTAQ